MNTPGFMAADRVSTDGLVVPTCADGWAGSLSEPVKSDAKAGDGWAQVCAYCSAASLSNARFVGPDLVGVFTYALGQYAGEVSAELPITMEPGDRHKELARQLKDELQEEYDD